VVVQTVAFQNNTLCWRYKQLLFKSTPTLVVQIKLVPKSLKAQDAAVAKLLMSWGSIHGLSCTKNAGRFPRHSAINSILKWSLTRIGLP